MLIDESLPFKFVLSNNRKNIFFKADLVIAIYINYKDQLGAGWDMFIAIHYLQGQTESIVPI